MYMYQCVRLPSSHAGLQWHVACWMHGILVYHFNKQASHVLLSIQFDTNVSQLLRPVLSWSCDPLPSLGELSSSRLNRLSVCLSCLFWLCIPPAVYGRHILCLRGLRVALFSEKIFFSEKMIFFFYFFPKKMDSRHKKNKKNSSRQPWRQPDVSCHTSAPPHLTTDVSPWQLRDLQRVRVEVWHGETIIFWSEKNPIAPFYHWIPESNGKKVQCRVGLEWGDSIYVASPGHT
jgi:hypothetical protein